MAVHKREQIACKTISKTNPQWEIGSFNVFKHNFNVFQTVPNQVSVADVAASPSRVFE